MTEQYPPRRGGWLYRVISPRAAAFHFRPTSLRPVSAMNDCPL